jgi:2-polyprenyl-3-methyl-5-hydroxy-6-metoxy-1,4-benzoquinol methylase
LNLQEAYYRPGKDYRNGSPHLSHPALHDRLVEVLRRTIRRIADQGLPLRVLEIGAGHGGFTESALAMGCDVTAVDMSGPAIEELQRRFGTNPRLRAIHDADGTLSTISGGYSLLMCISVLHHIPDYVGHLKEASERISRGGALLTLQDPMWYPRHRLAHRVGQAAYFTWRLGDGSPATGLQTRLRRISRTLDETNPSDAVEYQVVRNGIDEEQVLAFAREAFAEVELIPYWSSQLRLGQSLGERFGLRNSFGMAAHGYRLCLPAWRRGSFLASALPAQSLS